MNKISNKIFKNRACEIARNCKCDVYQKALASMFHMFFDKKTEPVICVK